MKYQLYQINPERDENCALYQCAKTLERAFGFLRVDRGLYDMVYEGEMDRGDLEDLYRYLSHPTHNGYYRGRAMTVSDVVYISDCKYHDDGYYFCDNIGFWQIPFLTGEELDRNRMSVVVCEPGKEARIETIDGNLECMQAFVGGYIDVFSPFEDGAIVVRNDESSFNGSKPCRAIYDSDGNLMDVVFGTFFICDGRNETMGSLSDEQLKKYCEQFKQPERLCRVDDEFVMVKY